MSALQSHLARWAATFAELADPRDPARRLLSRSAVFFLVGGAFHLLVWGLDGGPWAGPVTWRKPIVFGLSIGLTSLSLSWMLGRLRPANRLRAARIYTVAMVLEYGLIVMQRWRGVGSHFNFATVLDNVVFGLMGALVLVASAVIVVWTHEALRTPGLAVDTRVAVVGGLLLLDVGLVVGVLIAMVGSIAVNAHAPGLALVAAGLKPAHAIALHGPQTLPVLAGLLPLVVDDAARRARWIGAAGLVQLLLCVAVAIAAAMGSVR